MSLPASDGDPQASPAAQPTPREIRSQLLPEEVEGFDSEYRSVMAEATEPLDLTPVHELLRRWGRIARLTQHDPQAHRRMLWMAAALNAGEDVPMTPWRQVKSDLGL